MQLALGIGQLGLNVLGLIALNVKDLFLNLGLGI